MAIYCPHCGAQTDENDKFCIVCGELIHGTAECGNCGEVVPVTAAYCPKCGVSFVEYPELCVQRRRAVEGSDVEEMDSAADTTEGSEPQDEPEPHRERRQGLFSRRNRRHAAADAGEFTSQADTIAVEEGDEAPSVQKRKFFGMRSHRTQRKVVETPEEPNDDTVLEEDNPAMAADQVSPSVDAPAEQGEEENLTAEESSQPEKHRVRKRKAHCVKRRERKARRTKEKAKLSIFALLIQKMKRKETAAEGQSDSEDPESRLPADTDEETSPKIVSEKTLKHKKKVDEQEKAAMDAFESIANRDGYYNDVRPADFGEDEEDRPDFDIKQIIAMIVIVSVVCAIIVKLQSML